MSRFTLSNQPCSSPGTGSGWTTTRAASSSEPLRLRATWSPLASEVGIAPAVFLETIVEKRGLSIMPLAADLGRPLGRPDADRGQRETAGVQGGEGDLQPLPLAPDQVLLRDEDVLQQRHRVLDPAQAHERVAVLDGDPVGVGGLTQLVVTLWYR